VWYNSAGMGVQPDSWIRQMALERDMIKPFVDRQVRSEIDPFPPTDSGGLPGVAHPPAFISYGLSSYGYDLRVSDEFKVFTNVHNTVVDPKKFDENSFVDMKTSVCIVPPNSFALARSVEYFRIPRNILAICLGKSTYARCGIIVNVTPFEPEWEGHVTLEISNTTPLPAKIYANEGLAQVIFLEAVAECEVSYADRKGKYMKQRGITVPRL
jgi:dCTP deaminase